MNEAAQQILDNAAREEQASDDLDRTEAVAAIRKGIEQFERGEFRPARQALEELRQKHLMSCPPRA